MPCDTRTRRIFHPTNLRACMSQTRRLLRPGNHGPYPSGFLSFGVSRRCASRGRVASVRSWVHEQAAQSCPRLGYRYLALSDGFYSLMRLGSDLIMTWLKFGQPAVRQAELVRAEGLALALIGTLLESRGVVARGEFSRLLGLLATVTAETEEVEGQILAVWASMAAN